MPRYEMQLPNTVPRLTPKKMRPPRKPLDRFDQGLIIVARKRGRFLEEVISMNKCVAIAAAAVLCACAAFADDVPKAGVYLGYQYVRFNSTTNLPGVNAHGGNGEFIYNFNNWLSGVADLGAVNNSNLAGLQLDTTIANFLFGPRVTFRHKHRVQPFVQVLWGGVYQTSSTQIFGTVVGAPFLQGTLLPGDNVSTRLTASQTSFAMTAGGGLDIRLGKHVSFRPITVEYYLTRLQNFRTLDDNNQDNIRASAGFTFLFGGEKPTPPPAPHTKTCPNGAVVNFDAPCPKLDVSLAINAPATEICQGETTLLTSAASGAPGNQLTYMWSVNGARMSQNASFNFGGPDRAPGVYKVNLAVSGSTINPVSSETTITVKEYRPPTGTVSASPSELKDGETATLTANFEGQCGGPIQAPAYEAAEGTVNGNQFSCSGVNFDSSNNAEQRKTVQITAKAADNRTTGTATTTVECVKPATIAAIRLPDVLFAQNNARVNNCGKRILLDQLKAYVQRDATGTVYLVGHTATDENASLAEQRAMNSAAVITAGSGICISVPQSQVQLSWPGAEQNGVSFESGFCQSSVMGGSAADVRRVEVWFVPAGGQPPASVTNSQAASALPVGNLGCPK
jgi:outer membrane protein OmpA-like peptidoglycan-associated protein